MAKYTNISHTCPYEAGTLWIKVDSIPEDTFTFENSVIPSGNYRINVMESPAGAKPALYLSVSDHRLEIA